MDFIACEERVIEYIFENYWNMPLESLLENFDNRALKESKNDKLIDIEFLKSNVDLIPNY